ncbi:response regulator transcription factor [Nocardia anaemiae]|uniref:response regulator transcription factor n=1 Tax=Nocardia anaemiae TaxID=263910 RepID=UPI0007C867BE|nr:response regulator transcription factor [Nocardia anaemiae]
MRVIVVDNNDDTGDALVRKLRLRGHHVDRKRRGSDLLVTHHRYHAVILDLDLPDMSGLAALRKLREVSSVPVVVLTSDTDERSVVRALRSGADDYLVKPPRVAELTARLHAITRRLPAAANLTPTTMVVAGDVQVDLEAETVEVAGRQVQLTRVEFAVLRALLEQPGAAVSRQQLLDRIWGDAFVAVSHSLYVHVNALRSKLSRPGLITTIHSYGYRWNPGAVRTSADIEESMAMSALAGSTA